MPEIRRLAPLLAMIALAASIAAGPAGEFEAEYLKAASTILCDCGCHPQSVHACACSRAAELRGEIRALIEGGLPGDAVVAKYVFEKGDQIRIAPTVSGFNLLAWLGPLVALLLAIVGTLWLARRWSGPPSGAPADADPSGSAATPDETDPLLARLRRELDERP